MANSTKLRFIAARTKLEVVQTVESLPFKVEIKAIQPDKNGWVAFFTISDVNEFKSIDLREI